MNGPAAAVVTLTPAQYAIARELARDGADNATIGRRLGYSPATVATYLNRTLAATGCPTRTALVVELLRGRLQIRNVGGRNHA